MEEILRVVIDMSKKAILKRKLKIINIGLKSFGDNLKDRGVEVVHVDWHPPAGGDLKLLKLLEKLR